MTKTMTAVVSVFVTVGVVVTASVVGFIILTLLWDAILVLLKH